MSSSSKRLEKKQSWSFGFKSKQIKPKQAVVQISETSSLPKEFFVQLIKLETDFQNGTYTLDTLNHLTQYYAKAVEYYDNLKDYISCYFIFKIQDILATKQSLTMLSQNTHKNDNKENKQTIQEEPVANIQEAPKNILQDQLDQNRIVEENSDDEEDIKIDEIERKRRAAKRNRSVRVSISQIRNEKQRFVHFFYKMENEMVHEKKNMNNVLNDFTTCKEINDQCVKDNLEKQKQRMRQKLQQKKMESFASQTITVNNSRYALQINDYYERKANQTTERGGQTLEFMLNELDDGEELDYKKFASKPESANGELSPRSLSMHEEYGSPYFYKYESGSSKDILTPQDMNKQSLTQRATEGQNFNKRKILVSKDNSEKSSAGIKKMDFEIFDDEKLESENRYRQKNLNNTGEYYQLYE